MRAVKTTDCYYFSSKESDHEYLEKLLLGVNKRFFQNDIVATVRWEVPKGTVSLLIGDPEAPVKVNNDLLENFERAKQRIQNGEPDSAIPFLESCAASGHADSKLLLSHLLKRRGDERWQKYAQEYNRQTATVRAVPAACYYPESRTIAIHPHLEELNTPQFVLKYLLYHECCHQLLLILLNELRHWQLLWMLSTKQIEPREGVGR